MLNSETRRRIDACRDVLVGKLPSPQAQVEQITLALMYKFMNDMDRESMELGGKPQFFARKFADYSWDRITDKRLSGVDRIKLYSEGIEAVNKNEAVPELFREIFKNAFLPYRDPETFNLFAKEISGFAYEHSEDLGDAYEYLLSIMSSQGDAGQFRTPRHIIDFMVEVVRPRVGERVLDPACGTGGFLISAYKHMRAAAGRMTPAKLEKLHKSIEGYDISPDMVRLSRVNMYLHQFPQPAVHEYDTLSDESRWADKADVILANPPFMTPKGGIRPHKKFGVKANRSEVLFVDYFMEHLRPEGRAAVIVPEGIIFQSAGAYASLRKLLLDGYLWAVASLPAGLFNPYSGVKTSILFMDRKVAALGGPILFAKVEADGFDLGAQRRANGVGDLPAALELLLSAHDKLAQGAVPADLHGRLFEKTSIDHLAVPREVVLAEGDHSLSMERYRPQEKRGKQKWPMVRLGEKSLFTIESGGTPDSGNESYWDGGISWATLVDLPAGDYITNITKTKRTISKKGLADSAAKLLPSGSILCSTRATIGRVGIARIPIATNQGFKNIKIKDSTKTSVDFVAYMVKHLGPQMNALASGGTFKEISKSSFEKLSIPLPPLSVQEEIIAEIGRYQAVIDGARAVVDNWRPSFAIDPECPVVKLGDKALFSIESGGTPDSSVEKYWNGDVAWATLVDLPADDFISEIKCTRRTISRSGLANSAAKLLAINTILCSTRATIGRVGIARIPISTNQGFKNTTVLAPHKTSIDFIAYMIKCLSQRMNELASGGTFKEISKTVFSSLEIPLPPLSVQKEIVARIEAERELVRSNEKLIELMKQRIEETIARVWE